MTESLAGQSGTRLQGGALWAARAAWIGIVMLMLWMYAAEAVRIFEAPATICNSGDCTFSPTLAETLRASGISLDFAALYSAGIFTILLPLGFVLVAAVIIWQRSDDWMGLLVSFLLIFLGTNEFSGVNLAFSLRPGWTVITSVLATFGLLGLPLLFFVFPNGKFVPRWSRWLMALALGVSLISDILLPSLIEPLFNITFFAAILPALGGQVFRYLRLSSPVERQQTKWAIIGLVGPILTVILWLMFLVPIDSSPIWSQITVVFMVEPLMALLALLFPALLAVSILRYRLWDIDVIIRRTLIYSVVTASLALVYFGGVALLQNVFTAVTGNESPLALVASTLAIAALFTPLRNRVQAFVDRLFYRSKYDAERTLEAFAESLRDEVEIEHLQAALIGVVEETIQPELIDLWVKRG